MALDAVEPQAPLKEEVGTTVAETTTETSHGGDNVPIVDEVNPRIWTTRKRLLISSGPILTAFAG
jgi:hypothetical protein